MKNSDEVTFELDSLESIKRYIRACISVQILKEIELIVRERIKKLAIRG